MKSTRLLAPAAAALLVLFGLPQIILLSRTGGLDVWGRLFDPLYATIFARSVAMCMSTVRVSVCLLSMCHTR